MPLEHVPDGFGVLAARRYACQARLDNSDRIGFKEGFGVHPAHELAAVQPVAVVHQPAELLAQRDCRVGQARGNQTGEVRFDLVIDVVRVMVVIRMSGIGGHDSVA